MNFVLKPWQLLRLILAGWINRHQQDAIEYLLTENQVLREKLGKRRILLNDDQRRRLAVKGKVLGRKSLGKLAKIVEVWTRSGLVTFYIFVVMHLKMRRIEIAGATPHPNSAWMQRIGRNLTDCVDGFFCGSTHVILDRDTKHLPLRQILKSSNIEAVVLPPKSPNLNAH